MSFSKRANLIYRAWRYRWKVERAEIAFVLRHLAPGQTALDIGAHKGAFTYWMQRAVGPTGHVFAFEPQPELASYLREVMNGPTRKHVTILESALSVEPGELRLFRPGTTPSPGASLEKQAAGEGENFSVRVESLNNLFASSKRRIDFIKCDVEGHELDVFRGADSIFRRDRPVLLFECEPRHHARNSTQQVFEFLQGLDYTGFFFRRGNSVPLADLQPQDQSDPKSPAYVYNFTFFPSESLAARRLAA